MRRYLLLALGVGLGLSGLGCVKTLRYTSGICDCNPPPVETLLVQPCPTYHPIVNPYPAYMPAPVHVASGPARVASTVTRSTSAYGGTQVPAATVVVPPVVTTTPTVTGERMPMGPSADAGK